MVGAVRVRRWLLLGGKRDRGPGGWLVPSLARRIRSNHERPAGRSRHVI